MYGHSNGSSKKRSQRLLLLVLALGMALVSVMLLHKLREGRMFSLVVQDQNRQISMLQIIVQRERENLKDMKRKLENLRAKNFLLRNQKKELTNKLTQSQTTADYLQKMQHEMEATIEEKQNQIKGLAEKDEESIKANLRVTALSELLQLKDAELEEMKQQLKKLSSLENNTTPQVRTTENATNKGEGKKEASNADETRGEQNEDARKEGRWVKVETNAYDESKKDQDAEASGDQQKENPVNSEENKSWEKRENMSQGNPSEVWELNEEHKNADGKDKNGQEDNKAGATATSQESTMEVEEHNIMSTYDGDMLSNHEKEQIAATKDGGPEKPENSQNGNENQTAPEEMMTDAESKQHKVRQHKNRRKGRRRRKSANSMAEDSRYGTKENNEVEHEQDEGSNIGSQADGSANSQGQSNPEVTAVVTEERPLESSQADSINRTVEAEVLQSEKSEISHNDKATNDTGNDQTGSAADLNKEKENDAVDYDKNENGANENKPSVNMNTKQQNDREKQNEEVGVDTTTINSDNAADKHQAPMSDITTNTDDGSINWESQNEN